MNKPRSWLSAFLIAGILMLAAVAAWHLTVWHWAVHVTGSDYGEGLGHFSFYDFLSGFGSDLSEYVVATTVIASAAHFYWRFTCHEPKCWRPGHLMADGHTRSCWHCHPEGKPQPGHVRRKYEEHKAQQAALLQAASGRPADGS